MEKEAISLIKEISTKKDSWKVKVRIVSLWRQTYKIDMILMDEKGDMIQATVKRDLMDVFEIHLQQGSTVILSKFGVGEMNDRYPVINHRYKLNFYRNTSVRICQEFEGPLYGFHMVEFDDILTRKVAIDSTIDVIGYLVSTTDMEVYSLNGRECKRIGFDIVDLKGNTLSCTMWDGYAQQFSTFIQDFASDDLVIVIIQFGKVKDWRGFPNIQNGFFGTRMFINDDIEKICSFRNSIMLGNGSESSSQLAGPLSSQTVYTSLEEFLKRFGRKYVEDIFEVTKETICVVLGTIKSVEEDYGWFYTACRNCCKKVVPVSQSRSMVDIDESVADEEGLYCPKCKTNVTSVVPRYKVRVRVQDSTGTVSFVLFDKEVSRIVGKSAYDIREQQIKDGDEFGCPREVKLLVGKRFIFKIEISSYNLASNYCVHTVLKMCDDRNIIAAMLDDEASTQDATVAKEIESDRADEFSHGCSQFKGSVSYTEDSEAGVDNIDATTPLGKRPLEVDDKDLAGQNSSTKMKAAVVKLEK